MIPTDEMGLQEYIFRKAHDEDINPAIVAHSLGVPVGNRALWWNPLDDDDTEDVYVDNIDLLAGAQDALSLFVDSLSRSIQFPRSTAFLHGLGVMSAAMVEKFFYESHGGQVDTVALYTVGAQPPSTGKSSVDRYLTGPIFESYAEKRKESEIQRSALAAKLALLKGELKKAKGDFEIASLVREIREVEEDIESHPAYVWSVNDPTPEGCEKVLAGNGGFFNVISDESSAIKVILGCVYGDKSSNNGIFLRAWDYGYLSVARSGRDGYVGRVRGAMAVLAQDASVNTILEVGREGEGVSERFLIIRERNLLGSRDHTNYVPIDKRAQEEYEAMARRVAEETETIVLKMSPEAENLIRAVKQEQEPMMADGGRYNSPMLRGVVGKNDRQISRIACVLHVIDNWSRNGKKSTEVGTAHVLRAVQIFNQLLQTYVAAADSKGFTGIRTELDSLIESLKRYAGKKKNIIDLRTLRDNIKNKPAFSGIEGLTVKMREEYLPKLQSTAHIVWDSNNSKIYINPRLGE